MLNDNVTATSVSYTTNSGSALTSQMKSHQSQMTKKGARTDNSSIGPTSKFKSSTKMSNLTTHGANIKHAYGYGGGVLASSNQNVQMRSHYPASSSNKLNSTSMVRQKTEIVVSNSNVPPPQ